MRHLWRSVLASTLFLIVSTWLVAQSGTTSLRGVISDANGAVLPGASVTITDPKTGFKRTVQTDGDGTYQFLQIQPSAYAVEVSATGFATLKKEDVRLQVSTPSTINFTMQVAATRVEVQVTTEAPLVNTQDASIGNTFNARQLLDLPSEGRDPAAILSLQPGVTFIGSQVDQSNDSRGGAVAGARSDQTNITWDGLDNNDQLSGNAFQGALRSTLDSLQEFRVTTNSGNADEGRSSGAQVSLVTKSGTNSFHGSLYEYNRNSIGEANDWFNKAAQLSTPGGTNRPPQLIRNTFGATIGGPIKKDRFFFFAAYEGQRTHETVQTTRVVPSELFRTGTIQYLCPNDGSDINCTLNTAGPGHPFTVVGDPNAAQLIVQLTPAQFARMDVGCTANGTCPLGKGVNPLVANLNGANPNAVFEQYPTPNTLTGGGDLLNLQGFTFPGANPIKHDTYIVKLDYKLTANGNQSLFVRGNLQNDHEAKPPQFPRLPDGTELPPNEIDTDNSKGIAFGYTALIRPNLINNFRYALVRQGLGLAGANSRDYVHFRGIDDTSGLAYQSTFTNVPVHNFVDDISWTKGKHTLQFGTNVRLIRNNRTGNDHNVSYAVTDPFSLIFSGIADTGTSLDPDRFSFQGVHYPTVDYNAFGESYDFAATAMAGLVTVSNVTFNQDKSGTVFAPGALIGRHFKSWEAEWYAQDAWRVTPNLVLTGGLRYSLLQPPYEANGNQAAPNISVGQMFAQRAAAMESGQPFPIPDIKFVLSGQANGKQPYWQWDYKDIAPRVALAYSPHADDGWLHSLFGDAGKSSIRAGYGIFYDHFGQGVVNTFDRNGSFGLTTTETNPYGIQDQDCAARFTGLFSLPQGTFCQQDMTGTPPGGFPVTPPSGVDAPGGFAIYWGMDDKLKTPYSHVIDFSLTRELGRNFSLEISYIGRMGRRLLQETDLAMPENIRDPRSGMDYFTAATMLSKLAYAGTATGDVAPIPYWENLFPVTPGSSETATQQIYDSFNQSLGNEIVALQYLDTFCDPLCSQLPGQTEPTKYNFFLPQFSSLWGWRTAGNSSYNALNVSLRHAFAQGLEFDINYTYSKSIDVGSNAERINVFDVNGSNVGGFSSQVINSWAPNQLRAVSDYDMTHQINANWIAELPVGRGKRFGAGMGRVANAVLGGWSFSGLFHWTSGLPFSIFPSGWSTNYNLTGEAILTGNPGKIGVYKDANGNPNMFRDPVSVQQNDFRHPYPGESGQRNELRGQGYLGIDTGLGKEWAITEQQHVKFDWEVFNVTNAVRFDAALSANNFDLSSSGFGVYSSTLTKPRVMQFSLRYSF